MHFAPDPKEHVVGLIRLLNPFCGNVTAPRHRTARAAEELVRMQRPTVPSRHAQRLAGRVAAADAARARFQASPTPANRAAMFAAAERIAR